jgi:hypothetical protein
MATRLSPVTEDDLRSVPGLRREARATLVAEQPATVLQALSIPGVGRGSTRRMLERGILTDPEGVQGRSLTLAELALAAER